MSEESSTEEVYVRSFADPSKKWQVSTKGGRYAKWSATGRDLFYLGLDGTLDAVAVNTSGGFSAAAPQALFKLAPGNNGFSISADGTKFLVVEPTLAPTTTTITVALNALPH